MELVMLLSDTEWGEKNNKTKGRDVFPVILCLSELPSPVPSFLSDLLHLVNVWTMCSLVIFICLRSLLSLLLPFSASFLACILSLSHFVQSSL